MSVEYPSNASAAITRSITARTAVSKNTGQIRPGPSSTPPARMPSSTATMMNSAAIIAVSAVASIVAGTLAWDGLNTSSANATAGIAAVIIPTVNATPILRIILHPVQ